jgi:hypothetical protein
MSELLRVRVELVEAFTRTKSILASGENFRIAVRRCDLHPAHRIFRRFTAARPSPTIPFMVLTTMNHVRAAAEPHHQIEERRKQKE